MNKLNFTVKACIISVLYWLSDSVIHRLFYLEERFEFIPSEINELWMRTIIVILLVSFGVYVDKQTSKLLAKEEEKLKIFRATVMSTQHILNNLLNHMQLILFEIENNNTLDNKTKEMLEESLKNATIQVNKLSSVTELNEENIKKSVYPK